MFRNEDILELLSDGKMSEIGNSRSENEGINFKIVEFQNFLENVGNVHINNFTVRANEWVTTTII